MPLLGIHLTLLIGPVVAVPAPPFLLQALQGVEVTQSDAGRSGFQITFQAGRSTPASVLDYPLLSSPLLRPFSRVILVVTVNATPRVLMDGVITHQQLLPSSEPGASTIAVTGEDISVMLDLEEHSAEHPAQNDATIATGILLQYAQYGLIPEVVPTAVDEPPLPIERVSVQQGTDLAFLQQLAARHAYVFHVVPGPAPFTNTAYWGPPKRQGLPQRALSVNLGAGSNVDTVSFQQRALAPALVAGVVQDSRTEARLPVRTFGSTRLPLTSQPTWLVDVPNVRRTQFRASGLSATQAFARAQALTDAGSDAVLASGELDSLRYGDVLQARRLVGLRGAGYSYDGLYYVQSVTHQIGKGAYKQRFTLARDGLGALFPLVVP